MHFVSQFVENAFHVDLAAVFFGNTLAGYIDAFALFIVSFVVFRALQWVLLKRLAMLAKKTKTDIDDTLIKIVRSLRPAFYYFASFYIAFLALSLPALLESVLNGVLIAWIAAQIVIALHILIDYMLERRARKEEGDSKAAYRFLSNIAKWVLWVVAVLMVLSNLGINVTSLIAGLGIGGIAVALAAQNVLGDLFSSFAIYFDKPFVIGDFIMVGEHSGTVEKIGIKTTRIRALQGEEIVISNQELTSTRIQNLRKMEERRVAFNFGVLYETPIEKVRAIEGMVKNIFESLESVKGVRLDRVHLKSLGASSLDFEVVYYLETKEYLPFMDVQQEIHFKLLEAFEKEGIGFAYPTQTIHLAKS
ncbi:mechanosensitive ion channel protein MscS [Candidatus Kaiserbacteria bacterium CG10_big_fil_rev_8_21_14_0_10_49_17]|uniref:Mechanosensitive ion channel protein MscS n=1 Tax=Candidatus Kaiserbacteria bacterium CG10_big_fil_rev_8_21_14_0_10_49_17 TaxID=1974609 RepID=A0A2M6WFD4_9BACT|nr:MAG: mechanosensitive ion channel protein MscS [Candidatus Kaiserbacteria bacterium CG10_big_fil_rev_8_21_14_0_10_49_17]